MAGPLFKWTNMVKGYQPRYFVLDEVNGLVSYYTVRQRKVLNKRVVSRQLCQKFSIECSISLCATHTQRIECCQSDVFYCFGQISCTTLTGTSTNSLFQMLTHVHSFSTLVTRKTRQRRSTWLHSAKGKGFKFCTHQLIIIIHSRVLV